MKTNINFYDFRKLSKKLSFLSLVVIFCAFIACCKGGKGTGGTQSSSSKEKDFRVQFDGSINNNDFNFFKLNNATINTKLKKKIHKHIGETQFGTKPRDFKGFLKIGENPESKKVFYFKQTIECFANNKDSKPKGNPEVTSCTGDDTKQKKHKEDWKKEGWVDLDD